jgi:hypothetical protein
VSLTGAPPTPPDAPPTGRAGFVVAPSRGHRDRGWVRSWIALSRSTVTWV